MEPPSNQSQPSTLIMTDNTRRFLAIVGIALALITQVNKAFADADSDKRAFEKSESLKKLSAEVVAMGTLDSDVSKPSARYYGREKCRRETTW
jgi:hypothetical protein